MNALKERMEGDNYLDTIPIYRFTFTCYNCESKILIKSDPATASYILEDIQSRLPISQHTELPSGVCTNTEYSDSLEAWKQYDPNV